mgnify:FL=1
MNSISRDNNILITGGGGYLGSKLAEKLVNYSSNIFLLDISFNNLSQQLECIYDNCKLYECDITNYEHLLKICNEIQPHIIYHFAALLERSRDFTFYKSLYKVNVEGTFNLLEALSGIDYLKFMFSSSSEVYGTSNEVPFSEDQIPYPASPYSLTKLMAEELIKTYSNIKKKPYTVMRLFNFYGEDMPENFFYSQLINALKNNKEFKMTGGEQIRDFLPIEKVIEYIIKLSETDKSNQILVNICSGKGFKLKDFAEEIAREMGKEHLLKIGSLKYRDNEVWNMVGDHSLLFNTIL